MSNTLTIKKVRTKQAVIDNSWVVEHLIANPQLIQRELNNRSFFEFFKHFWKVVSTEELVLNWHIKYLCSELQYITENLGDGNNKLYDLLINIPPGTTKTTIVSIMYPAWCWTRWYWMKFITCSYGMTLALEASEKCRDLIRSTEFKELYPEISIKDDKDTKGNYAIVKTVRTLRNGMLPKVGGGRYTTSVCGAVTGFHAHIIIWDDPLNPKESLSVTTLNATNRWLDEVISTRKVDKERAFTIGIMQRVNQNDPSGHLLEKKKENLKHICLPAELDGYADRLKPANLARYYQDGLLDPIRLNRGILAELLVDMGQYGYAGQMGQKPTPPGGGMFKVNNLLYVDRLPHVDEFVKIVRYWDKAGSQGAGCYTVGLKMGKTKAGKFYVMDVVRGQWAAEVREAMIRRVTDADGLRVEVWLEQEPGSGGKESAEATVRNLAGYRVYKELPTGDKAYRADPYSVAVNNGDVLLLSAPWNLKYVEELEYFPFSTYKDQVDASSGAFNKLTGKKEARVL